MHPCFSTAYVDRLLEVLFNDVVMAPETYQKLLGEVKEPGSLCGGFPRPVKLEAVANLHSRFSYASSSSAGSLKP